MNVMILKEIKRNAPGYFFTIRDMTKPAAHGAVACTTFPPHAHLHNITKINESISTYGVCDTLCTQWARHTLTTIQMLMQTLCCYICTSESPQLNVNIISVMDNPSIIKCKMILVGFIYFVSSEWLLYFSLISLMLAIMLAIRRFMFLSVGAHPPYHPCTQGERNTWCQLATKQNIIIKQDTVNICGKIPKIHSVLNHK